MSGLDTTSRVVKDTSASQKDVIGTREEGKTPSQRPLAATTYGESPIAAANGWQVSQVADSATSRKHPATFVVLTKTVERTATRATGGFGSYPSVQGMRSGKDSIVVGFDTEFVSADYFDAERGWVGESEQVTRRIVSYQFAAIDPTDRDRLRLAVILPAAYHGPRGPRVARLSFGKGLELAITALGLHQHPLAEGWTAKGVPRQEVVDTEGRFHREWWFRQKGEHAHAMPITLVAHFQNADLTAFVDPVKMHNIWEEAYPNGRKRRRANAGYSGYRNRRLNDREPDILRAVISASAGMVSPKPVEWVLGGENKRWAHPVLVSIRDTMAQSGASKLSELGDAVGVAKLDVPGDWITRMDEYLAAHPAEFLEYASNDAVIALEYVSQMYGEDQEVAFEVAHVQTVPWNSPEEVKLGRSVDRGLKRWDDELGEPVWDRSPVRRTRDQWLDYFDRLQVLLDEDGSVAEAERLDRIAKGIVIAQRQGVIDIPWLGSGRPLAERLDAFEKFGLPRPKERFWSHARSKTERQIDIDLDAIEPYVEDMLDVDPFAGATPAEAGEAIP